MNPDQLSLKQATAETSPTLDLLGACRGSGRTDCERDIRAPRVLVAPDSFKGTMSTSVVASALAQGVDAAGGTALRCLLADGGEGTTDVLQTALGGHRVEMIATGPLGAPVRASYLLAEDGRTAVVEMAAASGLHVVPAEQRDAEAATSAGTGQLLAAAVASGADRILLGVGGSASTDGGTGALGALRAAGGLRAVRLTVLCDVQTPFEEAANVFAAQKGADALAVNRLTERLHRIAGELPKDPRGLPRTGAAGGLSGALWAVYDADLVSGIDTILDLLGFDRLLTEVDAVITGEGRLDGQTTQGKVIDGVTRYAGKVGVPVWAAVGQSDADRDTLAALGLAGVIEAGTPQALYDAARDLTATLADRLSEGGRQHADFATSTSRRDMAGCCANKGGYA
jgi:glycerate kinase